MCQHCILRMEERNDLSSLSYSATRVSIQFGLYFIQLYDTVLLDKLSETKFENLLEWRMVGPETEWLDFTRRKPLGSLPENRKINAETSSSRTNRSNLGDGEDISRLNPCPILSLHAYNYSGTSVEYL
jgi:hypothetical protein